MQAEPAQAAALAQRIDEAHGLPQNAGFFECLDASPAGRSRCPDLFAQLGVADGSILLEL